MSSIDDNNPHKQANTHQNASIEATRPRQNNGSNVHNGKLPNFHYSGSFGIPNSSADVSQHPYNNAS